jgi:hypothetical protein
MHLFLVFSVAIIGIQSFGSVFKRGSHFSATRNRDEQVVSLSYRSDLLVHRGHFTEPRAMLFHDNSFDLPRLAVD